MVWRLETIRASVFANDVAALDLPNWQALMGVPPNRILNNPSINQTIESGLLAGNVLTIGIGRQIHRADLIWAPPQGPSSVPMVEPLVLGEFTTTIFRQFVDLAKKWLSTSANVQRLGLACSLWESATTLEEALSIVLQKVPSFHKGENEQITDFSIQLNRPRQSSIGSPVSINRLARWSARIIEIVAIPAQPFMAQSSPLQYPRAQLDLDINTAGQTDIPGGRISDHLTELANLLTEISEKGDTP
jgi:hypothetical protein